MAELLSKELIKEILAETGGLGPAQASKFVRTVSRFRSLSIPKKAVEGLDVTRFNGCYDRLVEVLQADWRRNLVEGTAISRKDLKLTTLRRYRFREECLATQLSVEGLSEPGFIFITPQAFYYIMNRYFGGTGLVAEKQSRDFTDVESAFLERLVGGVIEAFGRGLQGVYPLKITVSRLTTPAEGQYEWLDISVAVCDFTLAVEDRKLNFGLTVPESWMRHALKQLELSEAHRRKADPVWQKAISDAVMGMTVEVKASLGEMTTPMEKSLNLKVGDVFPWGKADPKVTLMFLGRPRFEGTIGKVDGRFAVRIDEVVAAAGGR